ncbi:MAG: LysR family transcriptional regulator [Oscillospiraceae bacterium]|nr:LysR family transcriptional regulator [Oscillospiraceae bacterium]
MKLAQLQQLISLHEYGTFSKAAEALYISQPSLSVSIRELELELNAQLIIRGNRGIQFTPLGERVLDQARHILAGADEIFRLCQDASLTGELRVASTPHYCAQVLVEVKLRVERAHTSVLLTLQEDDSASILQEVESGAVDLGMIQLCDLDEERLTAAVQSGAVQYQPLFEEEMCVSVVEPHPLARRDRVKAEDLLQYPYGSYKKAMNRWVAELFTRHGCTNQIFRINDIAPLRLIQARERAFTVVPRRCIACGNAMYHSQMIPLPIDGLQLTSMVGLVYKERTQSSLQKAVIAALQEECGRYQQTS